jgi:hypothetical protein
VECVFGHQPLRAEWKWQSKTIAQTRDERECNGMLMATQRPGERCEPIDHDAPKRPW